MPAPRSSPPPLPNTLERHQRRRAQGIPTLTVLAGPPVAALTLWRAWLAPHARALVLLAEPSAPGLVREWLTALEGLQPLARFAADFLGAAAHLDSGTLPARLEGKTEHERDVLLRVLWPHLPPGDVATACQGLLRPAQVLHKSGGAVDALLALWPQEPLRALAAMHALVPERRAPAVLLSGPGDARWLADAARLASQACEAVPALVVALQASAAEGEAYLRGGERREHAHVREGWLPLGTPSPEEVRGRLAALGLAGEGQTPSPPLLRLAEEGVPDEVLTHYGEASRRVEATVQEGPEAADQARSAAERFLYALLEALPDTRGLFQLNAKAEFRLRGREVEVDFLSRRLRVAIEVDGYHHFRGEADYRRDRRKDLALQCHGYWVVRFLARDVVARLEEIRDTLRDVVSLRREGLVEAPSHQEDGDAGG
ncbi:endonuclease domain-containing protein [Archangium primigenium]|uniref:endonuclease domain-containing protein n=1 Tax=[Archangium] primigenium TaxID=2792470 RepID=UPI00195C58A5|nr:DUF559 domain-containing protein [Archangium primigenium]MBM7112456.1 DUF559 domain-containing protein [Archangium primigenium]